ncbi:hypothetical protein [Kribbella sp. C-35]|uniref:hypothetical protein n=1 Tax=Kribbella sp. C-35 TaxID=2789276 RepID=UPI0039798786
MDNNRDPSAAGHLQRRGLRSRRDVGGDQVYDFAVQRPLAMRWDGKAWKATTQPVKTNASLESLGGKERAVVYRYAAGKWQALNTGLEGSINGNVLAVLSAKNAWLGLNAGLAHFDGKRWTLVKDLPTDGSQIPTGMAAAGPKNIWLVGVQYTSGIAPLALHYNGTKWTKIAVPAGMAQLYDVALRNNLPVVVGERFADGQTAAPYVLQLSGSKLVAGPAPKAATGTLTGVTTAKDRVWTVGMSAASAQSPFAALAAFSR